MTELLERLLARPRVALREIRRLDAEQSLYKFVGLLWSVLEPGRTFVDGWVVRAICDHLEAVADGRIKRLLINVPPGCMKSLLTSVFWPAWVWLRRPSARFLAASYADSLSIRDNRKCRLLVTSETYQKLWGDRFRLTGDQNEKRKFENNQTGFKLATSVGGVGTGERADFLLVDDPHNVKEAESELIREGTLQWFTESFSNRTNDDRTATVIIMQRVHERDLSGHIIESRLGYEHLCLPMEFDPARRCRTSIGFEDPRTVEGELLWEERFSREAVELLKRDLSSWGGSYAVAGQLQQIPAPRGGGMFKRADFQVIDAPPDKCRWVRGWDLAGTAAGGARTAGVKMGQGPDGRFYVADVLVGQWSPYEVERIAKQTADADRCPQSFPQDPGQAGIAQKSAFLRLLSGHVVQFTPETGDKETRAKPFAAQVEGKAVYLVRGPWNDGYLAEMAGFPTSRYKDQADASSRAFSYLMLRRLPARPSAPELIG